MLPFGFLDVVTLFMLLVACPLHAQEKSTEAEPENTQPSLESLQEEYDDKRVQDRATTGAVAVVGTLVGVGIPTYLLVTGNKKRVDDLFHKCMHDEASSARNLCQTRDEDVQSVSLEVGTC